MVGVAVEEVCRSEIKIGKTVDVRYVDLCRVLT